MTNFNKDECTKAHNMYLKFDELENPTVTMFKDVYSFDKRFTHYNRFFKTMNFENVNEVKLVDKDDRDVFYMDCLMDFGNNFELEDKMDYFHIDVYCGDFKCYTIEYPLIKIQYEKNNYLFILLKQFTSMKSNRDVILKFSKPMRNINVTLDCYKLGEEESRRMKTTGNEELINDCYTIRTHGSSVDFDDINIVAKEIIVHDPNKSINKAYFDGLEMLDMSDEKSKRLGDFQGNYFWLGRHKDFPDHLASGGYFCNPKKKLEFDRKDGRTDEVMVCLIYNNTLMMSTWKNEDKFKKGCYPKIHWKRNSNSYPLTKLGDNKFIEGYWQPDPFQGYSRGYDKNAEENKYPFPVEEDTPNDEKFKKQLKKVIDHITLNYSDLSKMYGFPKTIKPEDEIRNKSGEMNQDFDFSQEPTNYVEPNYNEWAEDEKDEYPVNCYMGESISRLTGENVGCKEYVMKKNGVTFYVPSGITHYYIDHNVRPSNEFYNFIMNYFD